MPDKLTVNLDLIRKYDRSGPRYTSYPTALSFSDSIGPEDKLRELKTSRGPVSLYLHLPFCESLCWFCGCTKVISRNRDHAGDYLDLIEAELRMHKSLLGDRCSIGQLHFGGGTPNFLTAAQIQRLGDMLHGAFAFDPDAECSVELDPRYLQKDQVEAFAAMGIRRASFGVQDVNPEVQKAIHRIQPNELNHKAMRMLRASGYQSVNIDLIYGLPHQTVAKFEKTLQATLALNPDRFAVFNYAHVPWLKPAQKMLEKSGLPPAEEKLNILKMLIETLTSSGYAYIGIDHFARHDDELAVAQRNKSLQRNFQGYSTGADLDIIALGMSAISRMGGVYLQNEKELDRYGEIVRSGKLPVARGYRMTEDDHRRADLIMRLMCDLEIDFSAWESRWQMPFRKTFAAELGQLAPMVADGLLQLDPDRLRVTLQGRLFLRNIAMVFDAYLEPAKTATFSRTV